MTGEHWPSAAARLTALRTHAAYAGRRSRTAANLGVAVIVLFLALILGLASAFLPGWFVVSMLMMPTIIVLLMMRPEYALVVCLALACHLIHPALVPRVPLLGGSITAGDASLAVLVAYALWTFAAHAGKEAPAAVAGGRLLAAAFGLFTLTLVVAIPWSIVQRELAPALVLGETRDLLYLFMLPAALVILRQRERQERFVMAFVILGSLFAVGQIMQGIFSIPIFGTRGISSLETLGYREYSTVRSNTNGLSVMILSLLLVIGAHTLGVIRRSHLMPVFALLLMGILLTFGRTTFAVVAICAVMVVWWLDLKRLPRFVGLALGFLAIVATLGYFLRPESLHAVLFRMTSIKAELDYGYSAGWRLKEFDLMLPHILKFPFTGIGLGADYMGVAGSSTYPELNRYVHNSYLYMAGKMGILALAFFLLLMVSIFVIGHRLAKSDASPWVRIVGAAGAVMMVRFFLSSLTEPHLMSDHGVAIIAVSGALVYLAARRMTDKQPIAKRAPTWSRSNYHAVPIKPNW